MQDLQVTEYEFETAYGRDGLFQRLYLDLIGPFPGTKKGHIGILIVLDHFSKFTFLKPLKKFVSARIVDYLREDIFPCYGVPEMVVD